MWPSGEAVHASHQVGLIVTKIYTGWCYFWIVLQLWWCDVVVVVVIAAAATAAAAVDYNVVGVVFVVVVAVVVDFVDVVFVAAAVVSNWNNDRKRLDIYCHCLYNAIVGYPRYINDNGRL